MLVWVLNAAERLASLLIQHKSCPNGPTAAASFRLHAVTLRRQLLVVMGLPTCCLCCSSKMWGLQVQP